LGPNNGSVGHQDAESLLDDAPRSDVAGPDPLCRNGSRGAVHAVGTARARDPRGARAPRGTRTGVELALLEMLEHGPAQRAVTTHGVQTEG
jgi:hypothetical protein